MGWCAKDLTRPSPSTEGRRVRERWPASDFAASQGLSLGTSGGFPHSTGRGAVPPREVASSSGFPARFLRHHEISRPIGVRREGIYGIFPGKVSDGPRNIVTAILCEGIKQLMCPSRLKACFIQLLAKMQYFLRQRASEDVHGRVMTWLNFYDKRRNILRFIYRATSDVNTVHNNNLLPKIPGLSCCDKSSG